MRKAKRLLSMLLAVLMIVSSVVVTTTVASADDTATVAEEDHSASLYTTWWSDNAATAFAGGSGTSTAPYLISTPAQLAYFANYLEAGNLDGSTTKTYFKITANLDMAGHQWKPIGTSATTTDFGDNTLYNAELDGGNYTISNVTLTASAAISGYTYTNGVGLFARFSKSTVKNLNLSVKILDPVLTGVAGLPSGETNGTVLNNGNGGVAALAGCAYGSGTVIQNVTATVDMDVRDVGGTYTYAGLVGITGPASGPKFDTVTVNGDIHIDAPGQGQFKADGTTTTTTSGTTSVKVAGVLGWYQCSQIKNATNNADIWLLASKGGTVVGGVVAETYNGPIGSNLLNTGDITLFSATDGDSKVGGVFGVAAVLCQTNSSLGTNGVNAPVVNQGAITVYSYNSVLNIGGVVGLVSNATTNIVGYKNDAPITINRTHGGQNYLYAGGIAGYHNNVGKFTDCENTANGDITYNGGTSTSKQTYTAGLVGMISNAATLTNCINRGDVSFTEGKPLVETTSSATTNNVTNVAGIATMHYHTSSSLTTKGYSMTGCKNYGNVSYTANSALSTGYVRIGGLSNIMLGSATPAVFTSCENHGNVTLTFKSTPGSDSNYAGGLVGEIDYGKLVGCTNYGALSVNGLDTKAGRFGGLTGDLGGEAANKIENCTNAGNVTITDAPKTTAGVIKDSSGNYSGTRFIGGITGNNAHPGTGITGTTNSGDVTYNALGLAAVGGIGGNASSATQVTNNCTNSGTIKINNLDGTKHRVVGGLYGQLSSNGGTVQNSTNNGLVWQNNTYANANATGGLVGQLGSSDAAATGVVKNCINNGEVRLTTHATGVTAGNRWVGGLVGQVTGIGKILDSTNNGNVNYTATQNGTAQAGGIVADYSSLATVSGCTNNGNVTVTAPGTAYTGGIIGTVTVAAGANAITDCVNTGNVANIGATGNNAASGVVARTGNSNSITNGVVALKNCVNLGTVSQSDLSGGVIGYVSASGTKSVTDANDYDGDASKTDTYTQVVPYTASLENCVGYGAGVQYSLVGRVMSDTTFKNCFGNTSDLLAYRNQNGSYYYSDGTKSLVKINGNTVTGNNLPYNPATTATITVETLDKARLRLNAAADVSVSGLRFDSYITKESYNELSALTGVTFEIGTVISPAQILSNAKVAQQYDKMAYLDSLGGTRYKKVVFDTETYEFLDGAQYEDVNADQNNYFGGAIQNIKEKNYNLSYSAIGYVTVTIGTFTFTAYADYDPANEDRARSVAQVAEMAFEDRATEKTVIDGYAYNFLAKEENACYLGDWSIYSNKQLALLKAYCAYVNDGEVPAGLSINGVSISDYKIVYAQSPIYKTYGSNTGNTLVGDLGNVTMDRYLVTKSGSNYSYTPDTENPTASFGDALLGAKYDYDYQTAIRLRDVIKAEYGVTLDVVPDYTPGANDAITSDDIVTPETSYEILVGLTNRAKSQTAAIAGQNVDTFTFKIDDTKLVVCGGSYGATWHAVDALSAIFEADDFVAPDYNLKMAGNLSSSYKLEKIACIGDSITRGSQALPDGNDYGGPDGSTAKYGSNTVEIYFNQFLSYPANLQREIWKDAVVYNFGRGNSTARVDPNNSSRHYVEQVQWQNCLATTAEEDIDFDLVFLMHGTNDSDLYGGAATWDADDKADFLAEIKNIMDSIIEKGDDPIFVFNNAPHLMDNQKGVGRNEANDQAIRDLQKVVAQTLLNQGYNIYHYNMEKFGEENLVNEDATEACPDHSTAGDYTDEWAIHDDYFNLNTATDITEGTHPNFRGYNKMAQGIKDVVNWLLFGGSKPTRYMIDLEDVFTKDY